MSLKIEVKELEFNVSLRNSIKPAKLLYFFQTTIILPEI